MWTTELVVQWESSCWRHRSCSLSCQWLVEGCNDVTAASSYWQDRCRFIGHHSVRPRLLQLFCGTGQHGFSSSHSSFLFNFLHVFKNFICSIEQAVSIILISILCGCMYLGCRLSVFCAGQVTTVLCEFVVVIMLLRWLPGTVGRTSVVDWRTFPVLRSTCSWWVTTYVGKPSAVGQPTRPTQPFILLG